MQGSRLHAPTGRASSCGRGPLVVCARFGGRDSGGVILGGNNSGNSWQQQQKQAKLILPGQSKPGAPGKLVMPTKEGGGSGIPLPDSSELGLVSEISGNVVVAGGPPTVNKFRPPAGFMNETLWDDSTSNMEPQDMLNRLRSRAGKWHDLAKLIPALNSKGYDSSAIDQATGINPAEQNIWIVSATVYESLKAEGLPASFLANFDGGGEELLHPFRFLGAERRVAAAHYIIENRLDPPVSSTGPFGCPPAAWAIEEGGGLHASVVAAHGNGNP